MQCVKNICFEYTVVQYSIQYTAYNLQTVQGIGRFRYLDEFGDDKDLIH
jgi:hypothetical protein